jgi:hypothetical protein
MNWIKGLDKNVQIFSSIIVCSCATLLVALALKNFSILLFGIFGFVIAFIFFNKENKKILITGSVIFAFAIIELGLSFHSKSNNLILVGWKYEDYQKLFFQSTNGTWYLNAVKNFQHVHDLGEYNYTINTVPCGMGVARESCDLSAKSWHFGDSFTFGFGVEAKDTFVDRYSKSINRSNNFGVPGFNPVEMINYASFLLSSQSKLPHPEEIYLHFFLGNDIQETIGKNKEFLEFSKPNLFKRILNHSHMWRLLNNAYLNYQIKQKRLPDNYFWVSGHTEALSNNYWVRNGENFIRLLDFSLTNLRKNFNGKILISMIPPKEICLIDDEKWQIIVKRLKTVFETHQISFVDFYTSYKCPLLLDGFFSIDTHFNQQGHLMLFKIISQK